jgi:hypothetical protein
MEHVVITQEKISRMGLPVVHGVIGRNTELVECLDVFRSTETKTVLRMKDDECSHFEKRQFMRRPHPVQNPPDETKTLVWERIHEIVREFFLTINFRIGDVFAVETSHLVAPMEHPVPNPHTDSDEYGRGVTLLIYPRFDKTIQGGCLTIQNFSGKPILEFIPQTDNDGVGFIVFDGTVEHFVGTNENMGQITGSGVREAVFVYARME